MVGIPALKHGLILLASYGTCLLPAPLIAADGPATPIQAELVKRLDADRVRVGDSVLARVQIGWKNSSCELRPGDIIQGQIVFQKSFSRVDKTSEIAILFDKAQCGAPEMKPLPLTVVAVVAANRQRDPSLQVSDEHQSLSDAVGLALHGNTRSLSQATDTVFYEPRKAYANPPRAELKAGQVVGLSHVKLLAGQGLPGSVMLRSTGRELRLDSGTQFVLFPDASAPKTTPATLASNQPVEALSVPDPPKIADETEVCVPPLCNLAFDDSAFPLEASNAELTLPLNTLGYLPLSSEREMPRFDYHAGLAFLGPSQLLFTFNPHLLVKRSKLDVTSSPGLRTIRAVAVDLASKQVLKSVDWRVPDSRQYLWPLGDEQVLVHVTDELRVYGPGLKLQKKIALDGPLAFVRKSPSSAILAIGVVKERHTPEIHRQLQEAVAYEPEEDIEIRVVDSELSPITKIMRSSRQPFPVLLEDGEVRVFKIAPDQWRIVKHTWAGEKRALAQASSSCLPSVESLPGNLLFIVGCDHHTDGKWYRVLRDGKVLVKGPSSLAQFEHTASGVSGGNLFAIGIAHTKEALPLGAVFRTSDLESEHIALHSAKTGHRVFSLNVSPVVPAVQTFAISPREEKLAVLTASQIALYPIPTQRPEH